MKLLDARRLVAVIPIIAVGCQHDPPLEDHRASPPADPGTGRMEPSPAERGLDRPSDLMHAKLLHAHTLLDAIVLEDFELIEHSARSLHRLSREAEWQIDAGDSYVVFSDRFRQVTAELARRARERDLEAVSQEFDHLTASCRECHAYLRKEGLFRNLPGRARDQSRPPDTRSSRRAPHETPGRDDVDRRSGAAAPRVRAASQAVGP